MSTNKSSMLFPYIKCTRGIEMLLVRDHNAGLCSDGYCTWYSEAGSLEALYPHLLHFGPGPETDITSLQTAQELCEVAQQVPLHLYCISRRLLLDVRQNSTVAVPLLLLHAWRAIRAALQYRELLCLSCVPGCWQLAATSWLRVPSVRVTALRH
ncbi:hypothetical protein L207DRAFT_509780 [Hyaloscypha variabilis F]|uniref:Uncharacterized protein n=1 Tax=Hyaloscypha variabilis (strain UAMH 11265 / GT02V1 / F) TaxID=1149755 RepID=A0A2J6RXN2_HYAVF|nr:hypothetical protein L207DRAFT_509780 [Hyaloscypha variabilis F]